MQTSIQYDITGLDSTSYKMLKQILMRDENQLGFYSKGMSFNDEKMRISYEWDSGPHGIEGIISNAYKVLELLVDREIATFTIEGMLSYDSSNEADVFVIDCNPQNAEIKYSYNHYDLDDYYNPDADYDEEDEGDEDEEGEEFFYEDEVEKVRRKKRKLAKKPASEGN